MTYLQFHLVFLIPPLLLLAFRQRRWLREHRRARLALLGIALIAVLYTTPWDNYLVWKGVWSYNPDRIWATLGYVPVEEYLFFILQPLLTGLWLYFLVSRREVMSIQAASPSVRWIGASIGLGLTALGGWMLPFEHTLYLGLIWVWSGPVLVGQWAYTGTWFWRVRRLWSLGIVIPTVYLWIIDRIAIGLGIWSIADAFTIGWHLLGLPLEEAIFFLVTNVLVVQGLIMLLHLGKVPHRDATSAASG